MKTNILGVLGSALLLAGCGGSSTDEDATEHLPECVQAKLEDFALPMELTGIEVRLVCSAPLGSGVGNVAAAYGTSCAATACQTEVEALDMGTLGWPQNGQIPCGYHVIGMVGDEVVLNATNPQELAQLIGPVDTLAEAQLVAQLNQLGCERSGKNGEAFTIVGSEMIADCPIKTQVVTYRIEADGSITELSRGAISESGACVGRRPAGLGPRRTAPCAPQLGDYLARAAELEAASVVAFQLLEAELRAHGAPEDLLTRARAAAYDEVRHARVMQRLAQRFGGEVTPRSVRVPAIRDLESVARENALEGCVNETWGSLQGLHQARHARAPGLRRAFRAIAADEARHAQLSWDVAAWAEQRLDAPARRRIAAARRAEVSRLGQALDHAEPAEVRQALGLPDPATSRRLFAELTNALWS